MGKFPKLTNEDLKNYPKTKMKKEWGALRLQKF